jgi:hypothetical protein
VKEGDHREVVPFFVHRASSGPVGWFAGAAAFMRDGSCSSGPGRDDSVHRGPYGFATRCRRRGRDPHWCALDRVARSRLRSACATPSAAHRSRHHSGASTDRRHGVAPHRDSSPPAQVGAPRAAPTSVVINAPADPTADATIPVRVPPAISTALPVSPAAPTVPSVVTARPAPTGAPTAAPTAPIGVPVISLLRSLYHRWVASGDRGRAS